MLQKVRIFSTTKNIIMCILNSDCPSGHRCNSESGQCVPISGTVDPIKPELTSKKASKKEK